MAPTPSQTSIYPVKHGLSPLQNFRFYWEPVGLGIAYCGRPRDADPKPDRLLISNARQWDAARVAGAIDSALDVHYIHLTTYLLGDVGNLNRSRAAPRALIRLASP